MGHYVRLLSHSDVLIPHGAIQSALNEHDRSESISVEAGTTDDWSQLILTHADGSEIAAIERNPVRPGALGGDEIEEFLEEIDGCKPESAVRWLREYLPSVKCIYAFQILSGAHKRDGWGAIEIVRTAIKSKAGGIIQADGEGFSNEDENHILWQFSDNVKGPWWMAVLQDDKWVTFQMELGDRKQRQAFMRGEVPVGAKLAPSRE